MIPPRITFVVGPLAEPLSQWCERHGRTPSEAIRAALSAMLRVEEPVMPEGNPAFRAQKKRAKRATRKKRRQ